MAGKEQWQERGAVIHIHPPRSRLYSINALQGGSTSPQVSQPYKTMPPTEKKVFKRMNLPGTSHIQTILTLDMKTMWNLLHQEHYTHSWVIWNNLLSDYPSQKPHCHFLVICSRVYVPALINLSLFLFSFFSFTMLKFENWAFYRLGKCWATERSSQPHPFLNNRFLVLLFPENEIRMKTTLFLSFFKLNITKSDFDSLEHFD